MARGVRLDLGSAPSTDTLHGMPKVVQLLRRRQWTATRCVALCLHFLKALAKLFGCRHWIGLS
jgi:hypothetical protein